MRDTSISHDTSYLYFLIARTNHVNKLITITAIGIVIFSPHALGLALALGLTLALALATSTTP